LLPLGAAHLPPRRGPLAAATVLGAVGVASLPLTLAYPGRVAPYLLTIAAAGSVALAGTAVGVAWLRTVGAVATVVVGAAAALQVGVVVAAMVALGPLAVVLIVGAVLRLADPTAGTAFLTACAIAIVAGFVGAALSPPIVVGVTVLVLAGGTATTVSRLPDA
jgi:hypothetical protein